MMARANSSWKNKKKKEEIFSFEALFSNKSNLKIFQIQEKIAIILV